MSPGKREGHPLAGRVAPTNLHSDTETTSDPDGLEPSFGPLEALWARTKRLKSGDELVIHAYLRRVTG